MDALNKISEVIEKVTGYFLIFAFSTMTIVYFSSIIARFIFNTGIFWAEEYTRYINVAMVMFGSATVARYNGHTNISILENVVSEKMKKWVIILQQSVTGIYFGITIFIGLKMIKVAGTQVSSNMRIPMKFVYGMFPLAFTILVFQIIVFILNSIKGVE